MSEVRCCCADYCGSARSRSIGEKERYVCSGGAEVNGSAVEVIRLLRNELNYVAVKGDSAVFVNGYDGAVGTNEIPVSDFGNYSSLSAD